LGRDLSSINIRKTKRKCITDIELRVTVLKKLVIFPTVIIIVGLLIGLFVYMNVFPSNEELSVKGEIVQVYIKEWDTSTESGIAYPKLISYVFFLNITNLSDKDLQIKKVNIRERDSIIKYEETFGKDRDYNFPKDSSRLIALKDINGLFGLSLKDFENKNYLDIRIVTSFLSDEQNKAAFSIESILPLERINSNEHLFSNHLAEEEFFIFGQQPINAWLQEAQIK